MDLCVIWDRADVMIIRWVYVFGFSALCLHSYSLKYKGENENEAKLQENNSEDMTSVSLMVATTLAVSYFNVFCVISM